MAVSSKGAQYNLYLQLRNLGELSFRLRRRLVSNLTSENGWDIATFFHNHVATTKPELQSVTHINWQSINTTVDTLVETGFIKRFGRVGLPYRTRGRPIPIYGLLHATPEDVLQAQRRYGEIRRSKIKDPLRQTQIPEAIALCKTYMDKWGATTIPDRAVLVTVMKQGGIKAVNYDHLVSALIKAGYRF